MSQALELINRYAISKDDCLISDIISSSKSELLSNKTQISQLLADNAAIGIELVEKFYNRLFTEAIDIDSEIANQYNNKLSELNNMRIDVNLIKSYLLEVNGNDR